MALVESQPIPTTDLASEVTPSTPLDIDKSDLVSSSHIKAFVPEFLQEDQTIESNITQNMADSNVISSNPAPETVDKAMDEVAIAETARPKKRIDFEDWLDLNDIVFEWADSYDNKDWKRLEKILAPLILVDYTIVGHGRTENMPAADFIGMMSSPDFLGDPLVRTQHLMGARKFEYISENEILGHHQIRAAHQRYCPDGVTVENRGHGHSFIQHWYNKIDGVWKLSGLCPRIYWNEHNFDRIFISLKGQH